MTRYSGGGIVPSGWYLDTGRLAPLHLPAPGRLPGPARRSFLRVPLPALVLLAPLVGGAWLLAAPVVGLASAVCGLARRAAGGSPASRGHVPGEADLTGKPGREAGVEAGLEDLERKVAGRRGHGRPGGL